MNQTKKHTTGKKLLALLLALIMSVSLLPMSVFAADLDADAQQAAVDQAEPADNGLEEDTTVPEEPVEEGPAPVEEPVAEADTQAMENEVAVQASSQVTLESKWLNPTPTGRTVDGYQFSIMFLDCGRKYFSVDSIKQIIDNASTAGFNYLQLAVGNDGLRFLLNDMSLTVNGTTYTSEAVSKAIHDGNEAYYNFTTDELTQGEMDTIIAYAASQGMGVIPCVNTPGHMDAILDAAEALTGVTCSYNGSARTIDVTNSTAVAFTQALLQKYINYFQGKGCKLFNMGADEYANDKYTSGSMGFGNLQSTGKYSYYVQYVNQVAAMIKAANMTPMAFNDGIYFNSETESGTFDTDIIICYWSNGWDGYTPMPASTLANMGFKMINSHGSYYWVLGKSDWQCSASKASGFNYKTFQGSTIDNPVGAMFLIWCDYPGADTEANVVSNTAATIAAFGKTLPETKTVETDTTVSDKTESGETVAVTAPGLTSVTVTTAPAPTVTNAAEGKVAAYDVKPSTESGSYTGKATVSFPIPDGWDTNRVRGFVVNSDKSVTDNLTGEVVGGKFQFTAPHFSVMGIYELSATAATKTEPITVSVGGETSVTVDGSVGTEGTHAIDEYASYTIKHDTKTTGGTPVQATSPVGNGIIIGTGSQWLVLNGTSIESTTDPSKATKWTVTESGSSYTIKSGNYYLNHNNNTLGAGTSSANWSWSSSNGFYYSSGSGYWTTTYYLVYSTYSSKWTLTDSTYFYTLGQPYTLTAQTTTTTTTITFKGLAVGETSVQIGDTLYNITVTDAPPTNAMTDTSIALEYWITNYEVYDGQSTGTHHTQNIMTSTANATSDDGIAIADIAPSPAYSFFDTPTVTVYYWQAMRLDADNQQTNASGDDETADGTTLTHIRYHSGAWQYKTADGVWHYFLSTDQLVAYYLQKTEVTDEIDTYAKDWGYKTSSTTPNTSSGKGQVALTVAVVYPDGTVSPAEGSMYANSTTIFNYWDGRDIGIVAPTNNSDYNIAKITVTDGKRDSNSSAVQWYTSDSITWEKKTNTAGKEWYDETEVWNKSSGTTPMVNGAVSDIRWSAKNTAKLVLIYLEAVEKETNLNVQYIDLNANNSVFHEYQVAMKFTQGDPEPSFKNDLKGVTANVTSWPSNVKGDSDYLPDDAYVVNSTGKNQTFNKDITTIPDISGIYASGLYEYIRADISEDGKTLRLYYNLKGTAATTYVVDFGLPVVIPFSAFGIDNASGVTVSFDENKVQLERTGTYGKGVIDMDAKTVTYTLFKPLDAQTPIPVYVKLTDHWAMRTVYVIPASTVYYEDGFA